MSTSAFLSFSIIKKAGFLPWHLLYIPSLLCNTDDSKRLNYMSTTIRMARGGAKKRPFYRIVVTDSRSPRDGAFIEKLGTYDPLLPKDRADRLKYDAERVKYWLSVGARPSDTIARFLRKDGLWKEAPVYTAK